MNHKRKGLFGVMVMLMAAVFAILPDSPGRSEKIGRARAKVVILVYHSVRHYPPDQLKIFTPITVYPTIFEEQLNYLKDNGYNVISFENLLDYFDGKGMLPSKPVIITFDDGWETHCSNALPILEKFGYSATFFIYTNSIGHRGFLTWNQIKELDSAGMTIGSHAKSHPYLSKIKDWAKLEKEIAESKKILEEGLGKKVDFFAYPFGDYDETVIEAVRKSGYRAARSVDKGFHHSKGEIFKLRALIVINDFNHFVKKINE